VSNGHALDLQIDSAQKLYVYNGIGSKDVWVRLNSIGTLSKSPLTVFLTGLTELQANHIVQSTKPIFGIFNTKDNKFQLDGQPHIYNTTIFPPPPRYTRVIEHENPTIHEYDDLKTESDAPPTPTTKEEETAERLRLARERLSKAIDEVFPAQPINHLARACRDIGVSIFGPDNKMRDPADILLDIAIAFETAERSVDLTMGNIPINNDGITFLDSYLEEMRETIWRLLTYAGSALKRRHKHDPTGAQMSLELDNYLRILGIRSHYSRSSFDVYQDLITYAKTVFGVATMLPNIIIDPDNQTYTFSKIVDPRYNKYPKPGIGPLPKGDTVLNET
jgi:hypothetical protein